MDNVFKKILKGKVVILGVGNILKADDGVGPWIVNRLKNKVKATCFDVGTTPENFTGKIIKEKPDTVLIIDAASLGKEAGEFEILEKENILKCGFSTHDISCDMFIGYLESQTRARIFMLGIQPKEILLGKEISPALEESIEKIIKLVREALHA